MLIAKDGQEALNFYKKESFDIVITDIQMPNMDGVKLSAEMIKQNKNQKIIIVSAYDETEYFIELIKIGVSGFMQKPLSTLQMLEVLYEVCLKLDEENESHRFVDLGESYSWDKELKILSQKETEISLTVNERNILDLFLKHEGQIFGDLEIFNHLYYEQVEKEFSTDAIKSLIKRLRRKIPQDIIKTHKNLGYSLKLL